MKPTIGRIVIYKLTETERAYFNGADILPAVIVRVWSDTCVNLKVLTDGNADLWVTSSTLQDDTKSPQSRNWSWPERT